MFSSICALKGNHKLVSSTFGQIGCNLSTVSGSHGSLGAPRTIGFSTRRKTIFGQRYAYSIAKASGAKKIVIRERSKEDERIVKIRLTSEGEKLQKKAASIPKQF